MFLTPGSVGGEGGGFPRIRGDVPETRKLHRPRDGFSPHTRGCS